MRDCGIDHAKAAEMIKERKKQFDKACVEFETSLNSI